MDNVTVPGLFLSVRMTVADWSQVRLTSLTMWKRHWWETAQRTFRS